MWIEKYLVISASKSRYGSLSPSVSIKERSPSLKGNEIALKLQIEIPNEMFTRPTLEVKMKIPTEAIPRTSITPEITSNIEKIIKEQTNLNIVVSVVEHEEEKEEEKDL